MAKVIVIMVVEMWRLKRRDIPNARVVVVAGFTKSALRTKCHFPHLDNVEGRETHCEIYKKDWPSDFRANI